MDFQQNILNPQNKILPIRNTCLILNSRQGKTPRGIDPWVKNTIEAVRYAVDKNLTVICSVEMNTWELILWAVNEYGGKSIVILPYQKYAKNVDNLEYIIQDFSLNLNSVQFCFTGSSSKSGVGKAWWKERDKIAFDMVYEIIPVSVRDGGYWSNLLQNPLPKGKVLNDAFVTAKAQAKGKDHTMSIEIPQIDISYTWNSLTHWTRRFYEPWPGETAYDFYAKLVQSKGVYSHRAQDTLRNIISDGKLYGSSRWMKGNKPVVAFTSLHPAEAVNLMKWRSRYVRYTFEPFGIAIDRQAGIDAGIKPVTYIKNGKVSEKSISERNPDDYLSQNCEKGDWHREAEWRFLGDLDLTMFRKEDVKIVVPNEQEFENISEFSPWRVITLQSMGGDA